MVGSGTAVAAKNTKPPSAAGHPRGSVHVEGTVVAVSVSHRRAEEESPVIPSEPPGPNVEE